MTEMNGIVLDQNEKPAPYVPLVVNWAPNTLLSRINPMAFMPKQRSKDILSDSNGLWKASQRGVAWMTVGLRKKDATQFVDGYGIITGKTWLVGGCPPEIIGKSPYTLWVHVYAGSTHEHDK